MRLLAQESFAWQFGHLNSKLDALNQAVMMRMSSVQAMPPGHGQSIPSGHGQAMPAGAVPGAGLLEPWLTHARDQQPCW